MDLRPAEHDAPALQPWRPMAGSAILEILRGDRRTRRHVEPAFAARVRGELSDRCGELLATSDLDPIVLDRRAIALGRAPERHDGPVTVELLRALLTRSIFELGVAGFWSDQPFDDAVAVLRATPRRGALVAGLEALSTAATAELRGHVDRDGRNLAARWPSFNPVWLPRTSAQLAVDLDGGRVQLRSTADLVVGIPTSREASICIVSLRTGPLTEVHVAETRALALIETARRGVAPFKVATYSAETGELVCEDVTEALLKERVDLALDAVLATVRPRTQVAA